MPSIFAGVTMPQLLMIINILGLPGLIVIIWYVDRERFSKQYQQSNERHQEHKEQVAEVLNSYKEDVAKVSMFYERNVELVETTQQLAKELAGIIHLNTQVQTQLVGTINNNMFCPVVRDQGPKRG